MGHEARQELATGCCLNNAMRKHFSGLCFGVPLFRLTVHHLPVQDQPYHPQYPCWQDVPSKAQGEQYCGYHRHVTIAYVNPKPAADTQRTFLLPAGCCVLRRTSVLCGSAVAGGARAGGSRQARGPRVCTRLAMTGSLPEGCGVTVAGIHERVRAPDLAPVLELQHFEQRGVLEQEHWLWEPAAR